MRYFIGNWKMFGTQKSIKIANNINNFIKSDKNRNKYRVIITPPFTLLQYFSNYFKKKKQSLPFERPAIICLNLASSR